LIIEILRFIRESKIGIRRKYIEMLDTDRLDVAIIGAGVIGLSVAWKIAEKTKKSVVVIERNKTFGQEISSRNSGVIHSGIYYDAQMLKSRLCVEGNRLLYEFCQQRGITYNRCGKIVVSVDQDGDEKLDSLYQSAIKNGVSVSRMSGIKAMNLEPEIFAREALYLPNSGIVDSHELMQAIYYEANRENVIFVCDSCLNDIEYNGVYYQLKTQKEAINAETVINCAGLGSEYVAGLLDLDTKKRGYQLHTCKGEYFRINQKLSIRHLIYPVPTNNSLGIHLCIDNGGAKRLGPNAYYIDKLDYNVDDSHLDEFYLAARQYIPSLQREKLTPDFAGIRPKLQGPGEPNKDFVINEETQAGYPRWINLIGIESPGLTSCLAIGEYVKNMIE
jgi:L-2-hydroxyglutarate oxidase LhgO